MRRTLPKLLSFLPFLFLFPLSCFAQEVETINYLPTDPSLSTIIQVRPAGLATALINILLGASGVVSFIYLLWGGLQWIMAGSDKDALEKARRKILNALIGLAIVFSSYAILFIIRVLFNVNLIQIPFRRIGT